MPIGGGQGAAADLDGNFTLNVPADVKQATVSYVGYKSQTVQLSDKMTVYLASTATSLDDVVVVAYGTASKESLTGSVAVVGSKDIEDRPITSVTSALEGNAPGVQVNSTVGNPGTAPSIVIRGFNSINGSVSPLYVVDGVPYSGDISDLNPSDIESMSVLKDAASAALYGAKGANGVVLITTKKAKSVGKIDVTLQMSQGIYSLGLPLYERLNSNEWMQAAFDANVNGYMSQTEGATRQQAIDYMRNSGGFMAYAKNNIYGVADNELFDANGLFVGGNPLSGYSDLDWWDAVTQNGHRQEYNVNAAAASEKYNVFASVGYLKENGYMLRTDFQRYNSRINANFQPTSYFKFGVNLAAAYQDSDQNSDAGDDSTENPFAVLSTAPIYPYYAHSENGDIITDNGSPVYNTAGYLASSNAAYTIRLNKSNFTSALIDANAYATAVIPYGFELTFRGNIHRDKTNSYSYSNNKFGSALDANGYFSEGNYDTRYHTFMQTLSWSHEYGPHHVDALLDHENYQIRSESSAYYNSDQVFPDIMNAWNFTTNMSLSGAISEQKQESYLARGRYNYEQKYFGELSIRRDGSSKFSKNNRWGTFWSVGGSWVITKEKFMHDIMWLDYLKLRAAYGTVGNNMSAGNYAYWSLYSSGGNLGGNSSNIATLIPSQLAANNIRWEATKTLDLGLEGSLFNSRLNFSVGYFLKRNTDLLMYVYLPSSAGSTSLSGSTPSVLNNVGTMQNRGWEISFSGDIIRNKDFLWTASIDASFVKNKVVSLPYGRDQESGLRILTEGKSLYEFYTYKWAGVDQMTGQSLYEMNSTAKVYDTYDVETTDVNGNVISAADNRMAAYNADVEAAREAGALVVINGRNYTTDTSYATKEFCGSSIPTVYGSFGTNLSWKGLSVGMLFTYGLGGKTYDSNYASYMSVSTTAAAMHKDLLKSWTSVPEGMTEDSPNRIDPNGVPQLNTNNNMNNNTSSSRWLTSSNYLVFKNLNVGYSLPAKWVNPLQLSQLMIGVSIDNLFTATKRKGMNPQQSWSGSQSTYYGTARVFSFQLTARF